MAFLIIKQVAQVWQPGRSLSVVSSFLPPSLLYNLQTWITCDR